MTRLRIFSLLLSFAVGGCSAITDFDRFGPGDGGGSTDGDVLVDGCTPMGEEICNDIDDDCNGVIDENTLDDPMNCGACGFECQPVDDAAPDCADGDCVANCNTGYGDCDGVYATGCEVDLSDPDNCAACGAVCDTGEVCTATGCASDCPGSEEVCGRTCVDTTSDTDHCGGCGMPCPDRPNAVTVCAAGSCDFVCMTGFDDCDGVPDNGCETALDTVDDCGTCGNTCSYASGMPACNMGACELAGCNPGFDDCDMDASNGCEADLSTTTDCGTCGNMCADPMSATGSCGTTGMCEFSCDPGFEDCDMDPSNGCEADLNSDMTCGGCSTTCSGGTPLCDSGSCVSGCMAPTPTRCGGSCVNTDTNPLHCGSCGMVCATRAHSTPTCASGSCDFMCDPGWEDCNGLPGDGCETSLTTVMNCGGCGMTCTIPSGSGTCSTGSCAIASCDTGFADCDMGVGNGCETDIRTPSDCGGCGMVCNLPNTATHTCAGSVCSVSMCDPGFMDCDGDLSNGCEPTTTYYRDGDGDMFGDDMTTMLFCAGAAPGGWVMTGGDCDDGNPFRNPGEAEVCDGIDNNCDFVTDEGFPVGDPCECEPGAERGTIRCDAGGGTTCDYPGEVCNGLDDDCSGARDDGTGFACVFGSTMTCGATGTQTCIDDGGGVCVWSMCSTGGELCDRTDDDGDGFIDEDVLAAGASFTAVSTGSPPIRTAYDPTSGTTGVIYYDAGFGTRLTFIVVRADGSLAAGPITPPGAFNVWDADITWDGSAFTIVFADGSARASTEIYAVRANSGGGTGSRITLSHGGGLAEFAIRCARVGTTNVVAAIWVRNPGASSNNAVEGRRLDATTGGLGISQLGGSYTNLRSTGQRDHEALALRRDHQRERRGRVLRLHRRVGRDPHLRRDDDRLPGLAEPRGAPRRRREAQHRGGRRRGPGFRVGLRALQHRERLRPPDGDHERVGVGLVHRAERRARRDRGVAGVRRVRRRRGVRGRARERRLPPLPDQRPGGGPEPGDQRDGRSLSRSVIGVPTGSVRYFTWGSAGGGIQGRPIQCSP